MNLFFDWYTNTANEMQFKIYTILSRLLLDRAEFGTWILISVYGFVNNIPNNFDRIPILLQHFGNFFTLKEQQLLVIANSNSSID